VHIDIDLVLYEGVWRQADERKTFLQPYNVCRFEEIHNFRDPIDCADCCLSCLPTADPCPNCLSDCEFLNRENSLCEMGTNAIRDFYNQCDDSFRIIHNCEAGFNIWGEERMLGHRLCKADLCNHLIAGEFYSETLLDSRNVTITLLGAFENPNITINGNTMKIKGDFNGRLTLYPNGDMFYEPEGCCPEKNEIDKEEGCCPEKNEIDEEEDCCSTKNNTIPIDRLIIRDGNTFGFTVRNGMNQVLVEANNYCDPACIFIREDRITI
ncbi:MAG: hypothetical protein FWF50_05905, partial [Defluviitaleaceae bacterium]|nr:hypothetical protein [Defluviitaleaceae bacterium]